MTGMKSFDKFLDFFNSNAGGVISTITNQQINFTFNQYIAFDFSLLESNLNIPCILSHIDFTGTEDFQLSMITSKKVVASFADLMMLGTGDAEYSPEEHNDAMKEIFNQVFGSLTTELTAEGVQVAGVATNVELSDLELQKEFMQDSKL
ncbi:MAG: chemotaxis protein CheX, partial [Candidatus Cloacimonetes bacterium]|nr:chemotaxis protein CheX [Candidatus Cloacimonadota bacterium]